MIKTTNSSKKKDLADDRNYRKYGVRNKTQKNELTISATSYISFLYNLLALCLHKKEKKVPWSVEC